MSKMFFTFKWGKRGIITEDDLKRILLNYYTRDEVDNLLKKYATIEDIAGELATKLDTVEFEQFKEHLQTDLDEKADQMWVEQEVQRLEDEIENIPKPDLSNYVTINTEQTITAIKKIQDLEFTFNGERVGKISGNENSTGDCLKLVAYGKQNTGVYYLNSNGVEHDHDLVDKKYVDNAIANIPSSGAKLSKIRIAKPVGVIPSEVVEAGLSSFIALRKDSVGIIRKDGVVIDVDTFFELLKTKQTFAKILMNNDTGGEYTSVISHMVTTDGDNLILNFTNYSKTQKHVQYSKTIEFYMLDN